VESEEGKGSKFWFEVNMADVTAQDHIHARPTDDSAGFVSQPATRL